MATEDQTQDVNITLTREEAFLLFRILGQHVVGTTKTNEPYVKLRKALEVWDVDCKPLPLTNTETLGVARLAFPYPSRDD